MPIISLVYIILLLGNLILLLSKGHFRNIMPFKALFIFILFGTILEICTSFLFSSLSNNLFFYHFYAPVEFVTLSVFFASLGMSKRLTKLIIMFMIPFVIISIIFSFFIQKTDENNSVIVLLESTLLILYCLFYLRHISIKEINVKAERNPYFWIAMGILFYSIGAFFVEGFINILLRVDEQKARNYYRMSFIFKYIMCIFCLVGILMKKRETKNNGNV